MRHTQSSTLGLIILQPWEKRTLFRLTLATDVCCWAGDSSVFQWRDIVWITVDDYISCEGREIAFVAVHLNWGRNKKKIEAPSWQCSPEAQQRHSSLHVWPFTGFIAAVSAVAPARVCTCVHTCIHADPLCSNHFLTSVSQPSTKHQLKATGKLVAW